MSALEASAPVTPVIELVHPLPGFPDQRDFILESLDEDGALAALRSVADPALRLLVAPPAPFFPDYAPTIDDATIADLSISSVEDVMVLVVLNPGASLDQTTANLRAPVVLNTTTRQACQVVLDDPALSIRTPLVR